MKFSLQKISNNCNSLLNHELVKVRKKNPTLLKIFYEIPENLRIIHYFQSYVKLATKLIVLTVA